MSKVGHLPRRLSSIQHPKCHACMLGKATKVTWRVNGHTSHVTNATKPGKRISVDQLESPTPVLIASLKGILTTKRYNFITVFVDNHSRFTYVQLQQSNSLEETLQAKIDFETMTERLGVKIRNYHANNMRFADNAFIKIQRQRDKYLTTVVYMHIFKTV
jgi:hypothetical protein